MSKRSGLSRLEDLKRGFVDIGRYRYILHKFDMETWRDKICPVCNKGFSGEPRYYFNSHAIHWDTCTSGVRWERWFATQCDDYSYDYDDLQGYPD